jgi:4-diphosphocytidyl-2-C-methyl-D-erythritol kinase
VVEGVGEQVRLLPGGLPPLFAVLANPGVPLETARVFAALAAGPVTARLHRHDPIGPFASVAALLDYMRTQGNDLERPAVALVPRIAEIKAALLAQPGCSIALMSGSGPTCSGIFGTAMQADAAAAALHRAEPGWWIAATRLAGTLREGTG